MVKDICCGFHLFMRMHMSSLFVCFHPLEILNSLMFVAWCTVLALCSLTICSARCEQIQCIRILHWTTDAARAGRREREQGRERVQQKTISLPHAQGDRSLTLSPAVECCWCLWILYFLSSSGGTVSFSCSRSSQCLTCLFEATASLQVIQEGWLNLFSMLPYEV